jgi:hypothetical protein
MARVRKTRTVYIGDQRWKIVRATLRGKYGDCDYTNRVIRIHHTLTGTDLMDTLLHELLHARWPDLLESSVEEFAATLTAVLEAERFGMHDEGYE